MSGQPAFLFDLDGTLVESAAGVVNGFHYAIERMGLVFPDGLQERRLVGPPLLWSFREFWGLDDTDAERAVMLYREYYGTRGVYEAVPYPGMEDLLGELAAAGARLCIATSKYGVMARKMLDHLGLTPLFAHLSMSEGREGHSTKEALINGCLEALRIPATKAVMVGDTGFDARGARETGVPFIGVLYGYGTREEMRAEGASRFAADVAELKALLFA